MLYLTGHVRYRYVLQLLAIRRTQTACRLHVMWCIPNTNMVQTKITRLGILHGYINRVNEKERWDSDVIVLCRRQMAHVL